MCNSDIVIISLILEYIAFAHSDSAKKNCIMKPLLSQQSQRLHMSTYSPDTEGLEARLGQGSTL